MPAPPGLPGARLGDAYRDVANQWVHYKNIMPIWDDDTHQFPASRLFLVHARSAYRDEGME